MKLHEWQQKNSKKSPTSENPEEVWVKPLSCTICNKPELKGAYGHWTIDEVVHWSCSAVCDKKLVAMPKYSGHTAADFEKLHNL